MGEDRRASESADDIFVIRLRVTDDAVSSLSLHLSVLPPSLAFFVHFFFVRLRLTGSETVAARRTSVRL